jgi:hypothetical protein
MTSMLNGSERMAIALERLQLRFSKQFDDSGRAFWQIPFDRPQLAVLTAYVGPIAAGVLIVLGPMAPAQYEQLLMLNAELTLAKVILSGDSGVAVVAELSAQHIDEQSIRLAITGVLEGTSRVRKLMGSTANPVLPAGK